MNRYGIAEWFGEPFPGMPPDRRQQLAGYALGPISNAPRCPFQPGNIRCNKKGGVCSIQQYAPSPDSDRKDRIGTPSQTPVVTCPNRFAQNNLIPTWLARIVGFPDVFVAREVPFMRSPVTGRPAGRIDIVLAGNREASKWFGLEIQAVYFSGRGMQVDFDQLSHDNEQQPPAPAERRRPDWRSSSAKRLMPQLQVKVPTLRRWGTKLAVAVDRPFFDATGGPSSPSSRDVDDGDIIWLVPEVSTRYQLIESHWEVLSLEDSSEKLLAAETVKRGEFEEILRNKLRPLNPDPM